MSKIIFVTGTDTGAGKTVAAATIVQLYRNAHKQVAYIKPIQTGCKTDNDAQTVKTLTGINSADVYTLLSYVPPLAPEQAALSSHQEVPDFKQLVKKINNIAWHYDVVIVEGAGGVYVPITAKEYMLDLAKALKAQVVVVARTGLGTINHTVLTIKALQAQRVKILGIIFSAMSADVSVKNNPRVIAEKTKLPVLGVIPRQKKIDIKKCVKAISVPILLAL